jgi:hypothetical protein
MDKVAAGQAGSLTSSSTDGRVTYMRVQMSDIMISNYSRSGDSDR